MNERAHELKTSYLNHMLFIERDGINELKDYLENSDFFIAPASTRFHGNYEGGLCEHSMNVFQVLSSMNIQLQFLKAKWETVSVIALLHDVCKIGMYKEVEKWRKDSQNKWESYIAYEIQDDEPYGHGEKSVMILSKYIDLTDEEMYCIRWHMGAFDNAVKGGDYSFNRACEKYPLITALHSADFMATNYLDIKVVKS